MDPGKERIFKCTYYIPIDLEVSIYESRLDRIYGYGEWGKKDLYEEARFKMNGLKKKYEKKHNCKLLSTIDVGNFREG